MPDQELQKLIKLTRPVRSVRKITGHQILENGQFTLKPRSWPIELTFTSTFAIALLLDPR